ncbi:MAG: 50S ribosomal protein L34 [Candidatus Doudnabacteria bacterium RIFCSPHIGHO2_02_FULL_48_21]|nr:MAG: 50S ribosomal protein L34 [Candidatus Doudnabacteria bacterium RIFCSPHIGHO2_01_48_18]OGE79682.1 MAG: 50S ribosomal protein L34 [Candidatus Doudnabacteria bacterium RIFCSPHIGHO2_01_FULL_48_180]OGE91483.1 MAG: 50S ribosomal protein L34 [Candidatus Doudnabacteria bacterium RIFCSPHIGHO2_12_FULL_47_25]OGE93097.1 MAG: 50S ribosomal protein L34 [Candidatus Doudnabacteria bacterium RIFCSPHIGHO2_02_FULL_48_21]OGF00725.1 MAG: 50S ribosomal protein L34 [Candidatus Doudnabacteria bacterium RIFCSPLO
MKRTYQPKKKHRARSHGFRKRMKSRTGRRVISARRLKKRERLTI